MAARSGPALSDDEAARHHHAAALSPLSVPSAPAGAAPDAGTVAINAGDLPPPPPPPPLLPPKACAAGAHGWSGNVAPPQLRWTSRYAAGRLVPTSFLNALIVASLRNPSLLRLVSMFARGSELRLRHVQVPAELLSGGGALFAVAFLHMALRHRVVLLGVYRDARPLAAPLPYVVTNLPMNARLRQGDVLFVVVPVVAESSSVL